MADTASPASKALVVSSGTSNVDLFRASTDAASLCREIVLSTAKMIGDRKYVQVEGWQAIAVAHGCTASARSVEVVDGGVRAIGEIRRMSDGAVIAEAEGFVGEDEPVWYGGTETKNGRNGAWTKTYPKRAMYAIRAMAQTRAISRACRSAFAHVVVMMNAGLSTTPAEEVPDGGFNNEVVDADFTAVKPTPNEASAMANFITMFDGLIDQQETLEDLQALFDKNNEEICNRLSDEDYQSRLRKFAARKREIKAVTTSATAPQTPQDNPFESA